MEIYKSCIKGENYEISNYGNCRKKLKDGSYMVIKGAIQNRGYLYLQLQRNGKRKNYLFHQLVMKAFVGDYPKDKPHIDHIDRNKLNNHLDNLRYVSVKENIRNMERFRSDIKGTDIERRRLMQQDMEKKIKDKKIYYCDICDISCVSPHNLNIHNNGYRHILKQKYKNEMEKNNIEWNKKNYIRCKDKVYDYNSGKKKTKPVIYIE